MLQSLSTEIVERILSYFEPETDFYAVRLVCRQLCLKSFRTFGETYFKVITTDLSRKSSLRLEKIAQHESLRQFVCGLRIGDDPEIVLGPGNTWGRDQSGCLETTLPLQNWLANRFVNCRTVEITDTWGSCVHTNELMCLEPADAMNLLLAVCAGIPIRAFHVNLYSGTIINVAQSQVSPEIIESPQFQSSWATHLQELEFSWKLQDDVVLDMAVELVVAAKNLRKFRVNWISSLVAEKFFDRLGKAHNLPQISELRIDKQSYLSQNTLLTFISRLKDTLKSLIFWYVGLRTGHWKAILGEFPSQFPLLEEIVILECYDPATSQVLFCPLQENRKVQGFGDFEFVEVRQGPGARVVGVRYRGEVMQLALRALHGAVYAMPLWAPSDIFDPDFDALQKFELREFQLSGRESASGTRVTSSCNSL